MADISQVSESKLKTEIEKILKDADLAKTTTKIVIQKLEKQFGSDIRIRKTEIDKVVMDYISSMDSEKSEKEDEDEEESEPEEKPKPKRGAATRAKRGAGVTKEKAPAKRAGGKGKGTGFTRSYKLSPALSALMGADEMPRHAVVKRIWALVKENNLYDPSNKQFAICDDALYKVIGKQRFRVFGMMKYLKTHFLLE